MKPALDAATLPVTLVRRPLRLDSSELGPDPEGEGARAARDVVARVGGRQYGIQQHESTLHTHTREP